MSYIGINVGAITIKVAALGAAGTIARVEAHQGRPLEVLQRMLDRPEFAGAEYFGVSGAVGHISEVAAIQRALKEIGGDFDAIASLGGESFLVYTLIDGRIANVLSHNKCAAGSGEFFIQQIGRMGLERDDAIRRSFEGKLVPLASRCSVHCKSDITHKLNRHEASPEDILYTLHDSMSQKIAALLEKGRVPLRRILLIGGMTQNSAMVAALKERLPEAQFIVLKESPWFEAFGTALLTRDMPLHKSPQTSARTTLSYLPPLKDVSNLVYAVPASPQQAVPNHALVLGVDAGSTTTKMTLIDPATRGVVAAHYTRTSGDPVGAIRKCLHAISEHAGNLSVGLIGTTGSARELAGAYLGTEYVFNEISAHAAGAAHFDPEVDTIFEIGGQDSKYIHLRNGVPIDYVMNNACSAGTGSFLEESARGDLGIDVMGISEVALQAPSPAHFKATCAAFINSDIRIAQQEGHSRDNIVAGLVYAIAENYLNRVKGPRAIGKKVFLQGGVALNRAVAHAFAQKVGRRVVIPPNPELIGALGVGLLALQRAGNAVRVQRDLDSLALPEMKQIGRFQCGACKLYCSIDRFEVEGRRFPFGGRCSLYENVWKRKSRTAPMPDLVEERSQALFSRPLLAAPVYRESIGIPKALTTYSLYPLYSTFLSELGFNPVLSGVDPRGDLKAHSGFCFPVQIAHGAVMDLVKQGVTTIFMPHVVRMPQAEPCRDSYLCPISQAGPYFMSKAFPDVRFLTPVLDFTDGYSSCAPLKEMAVGQLGIPTDAVEAAFQKAVEEQIRAESAMRELGNKALHQVIASGQPAIVLAGHSYNAFSSEASQSVGKKLSSMGMPVIPADCLPSAGESPTPWHFANQILSAAALIKQHPNLFLLCISNFSCTIDAFTHSMVASEMGSKPHLILEIDAHTADAGVQTRLEAFLDIVRNYRAQSMSDPPFAKCVVRERGEIVRNNGERLPITDSRVKIYIPNFSPYHIQAAATAARWMGLHTGELRPPDRTQLERGLQYTSGRECLPLPICIGQLLEMHDRREPGEIAGFYMVRGGAPCAMDGYYGYLERFIAEQRWPDVFLVDPRPSNDFLGIGESRLAQCLLPAVTAADIVQEIDQVLQVAGGPGAVEFLRDAWKNAMESATSLDDFDRAISSVAETLKSLPLKREPRTCPRVVIAGDFFTRFSPFFMEGISELYAERGIILQAVDLTDFFLYMAYNGVAGTAASWNMKPGGLALAKACTRVLKPDGREYLQRWIGYKAECRSEGYYRNIFRKTGLLVGGPNDAASLFDQASEHISPAIYGEVIPTIGKGLDAADEGYDGIILLGPFNCLPLRISEAILKPLCIERRMPLLSYESDGYAVSSSVLRQVDVHIQQVLEHAGEKKPLSSAVFAF